MSLAPAAVKLVMGVYRNACGVGRRAACAVRNRCDSPPLCAVAWRAILRWDHTIVVYVRCVRFAVVSCDLLGKAGAVRTDKVWRRKGDW